MRIGPLREERTVVNQIGLIADIQHYSLQDGPGIRTTVFVKGCPLQCSWCHNPEMVNPIKEVWYIEANCTFCGRCIEVCPEKAIKVYDDERVIDRSTCVAGTGCQKCVEVCPNAALAVVGKEMTVQDVLKEVQKDEVLYHRGGGACISGGAPLMQANFATEFLKECQEHILRTSLVTCAHASWDTLSKVAYYADLLLIDIKHMDPAKHKEGTGIPNELILENIAKLAKLGKSIRIRLPLIPGYNDSEDNLKKTAEFMVAINLKYIELLPFHLYSAFKYKREGKKYACYWIKEPSNEEMEKHKALFESYGLHAAIGDQDPFSR
jgi:pyruvate formate lyase activating enzyme